MTLHYSDDWLSVYVGDCRRVLDSLPAESVHCAITSPPYWALRDYGTAEWSGGDPDCDHRKPATKRREDRPNPSGSGIGKGGATFDAQEGAWRVYRGTCAKCGATRIDDQIGLESTPELYIASLVGVFRSLRRVLRADGTLWLNLGDSYSSDKWTGRDHQESKLVTDAGLPPKNLVGIPWRVALALQSDGWYLRSDVIWSKPNAMPSSAMDRPTMSHEYLFMLAKSERYFFDMEAVRERGAGRETFGNSGPKQAVNGARNDGGRHDATIQVARSIRSVWTVATQPYPGAHFATFPPKLVEPCIKASTSERGVCAECGSPWVRLVEVGERVQSSNGHFGSDKARALVPHLGGSSMLSDGKIATRTTVGWQRNCAHQDAATTPATLLDPFGGSGTVGMVAQTLSRRAVLIDLNTEYIDQQLRRNAQVPLGLTPHSEEISTT